MKDLKNCAERKDFLRLYRANVDLNPEFDPTVEPADSQKMFYYRDVTENVSFDTISNIMQRNRIDSRPPAGNVPRVCEVPDLYTLLKDNAEYNADLDFSRRGCESRKKVYFLDQNDDLSCASISKLYHRILGGTIALNAKYPSNRQELAKSHPDFMKIYEKNKNLNPHLDIDNLTAGSNALISYRDDNGQISTTRVNTLLSRKSVTTKPAQTKKHILCRNIPEFYQIFLDNADLNAHLDIESLTIGSNKIFYFRNKLTGKVCHAPVAAFLKRKNMQLTDFPRNTLAISIPGFAKLYEDNKDLNPDFDPDTVTIGSRTSFRYIDTSNSISCVQIKSLFKRGYIDNKPAGKGHGPNHNVPWHRKKNGVSKNVTDVKYAKNVLGFSKLFKDNAIYNPDLDLDTLKASSNKQFHFINTDHEFDHATVSVICRRAVVDNHPVIACSTAPPVTDRPDFTSLYYANIDLNPDLDITQLTQCSNRLFRYKNRLGAIDTVRIVDLFARIKIDNTPAKHIHVIYCCESTDFMNFFNENKYLNPNFDPAKVPIGSLKTIDYINTAGLIDTISVNALFQRNAITNAPKKYNVVETPALPVLITCPEISDYLKNVSLDDVLSDSEVKFDFICPACGSHFTESVRDFVNADPKCDCQNYSAVPYQKRKVAFFDQNYYVNFPGQGE